jgi:hypothetical protein
MSAKRFTKRCPIISKRPRRRRAVSRTLNEIEGAPKWQLLPFRRIRSTSIGSSIGTEDSIPEEIDHREIAVRVPVVGEVQFLLPSEPCEPLKPRALYMVLPVEEDVRVKGRSACDCLNHEEIDRQYEVCARPHQKHRNEEEGRIISFVT